MTLNREDYVRPDARADSTRTEYVAHVARSLELIGESSTQASADAKTIFALETAIAKITIPQADMRDPVATYHKMTVANFQQTTPHLNWTRYLQQHHTTYAGDVNVRAPSFFKALDSLIAATPVDDWKAYLRWHVTNGAMGSLSAPFRHEAFRWQQFSTGVKVQQARSKQCAAGNQRRAR